MKKSIIVFGPSGIGKTTAAKSVAEHLNIGYISSDTERNIIYENLSQNQKDNIDKLSKDIARTRVKEYQNSGRIQTDSLEIVEKTIDEIRIKAALYSTEGIRRQSLYNVFQNDYRMQIGDLGFCTLYYQNFCFKEEAKQILKSFKTILLLPYEDTEKSVSVLRWRHITQPCSEEIYRQKINRMLLEQRVYEDYKPDHTIYTGKQPSRKIVKEIIKISNS